MTPALSRTHSTKLNLHRWCSSRWWARPDSPHGTPRFASPAHDNFALVTRPCWAPAWTGAGSSPAGACSAGSSSAGTWTAPRTWTGPLCRSGMQSCRVVSFLFVVGSHVTKNRFKSRALRLVRKARKFLFRGSPAEDTGSGCWLFLLLFVNARVCVQVMSSQNCT